MDDSLKFSDDIEMTVAMHTNLVHWTNFRNYAEIMLTDDTIRLINGAAEYKKWVRIQVMLLSIDPATGVLLLSTKLIRI